MGNGRSGVVWVAVVVGLAGLAGCTSEDGRSPGSEGAAAAAAPTSAAGAQSPGSGGVTAVDALPPVAERWSFLDEQVASGVPEPEPSAERADLERRRVEAASPLGAGGDDRFTRVGEGTPVRFAELVVDVGRRRTLNPLRLSRAAAIVAVAGHEAALVAARTAPPDVPTPEETDPALGEPVAGVDDVGVELPEGQLPPEVVTAAAQRRVACELFPVECPRFEVLDRIATRRLVASGAAWPSTIDAARRLGESTGEAVLRRAAADGAAPWTARPDDLPPGGEWVPTPGMFAPALEPFAGGWRPWNLGSGDQFRPPPPPAAGTPEHAAATEQVRVEGSNLTDRDLRVAAYWDMGPGTSTPPGYWISDIAADALRQAPVADQASGLALVSTAEFDAGVATWDAKYAYRSVRPVTAIRKGPAPQWLPTLVTPPFPSYVSGHSAFSAAAAEVVSVLRPERAEELFDAAAEASDSRLTGGIHYWFDLTEGATLGQQVGRAALARAGIAPVDGVAPVRDRLRFTGPEIRTGGRS